MLTFVASSATPPVAKNTTAAGISSEYEIEA